jgi:Ca-activated chloride channel family protein
MIRVDEINCRTMGNSIIGSPRRLLSIGSGHFVALFILSFALLPFTANTAWSQEFPSTRSSLTSEFQIRSDVNLAVLNLSVRDGKGHFVEGLNKETFEVYEDGVLQQIESFGKEDRPVTIGLVIDGSGSMGPKRSDVIGAALDFAHCSNPDDEVFVVNFNEHVSMGLSADSPFTSNRDLLEMALSRHIPAGMTSLYDAIAAALEHLQKGKWDKKVLIVVSDGGDNASRATLDQTMSLVNRSNAIIYTVGVFDDNDEDRNPKVLTQVSRASGGKAFFSKTLRDVTPVCEQIARDIRSQYTLTYISTNKKEDGAYRSIDIKVRERSGGKRLSVTTRPGYYAPLNLQVSSSGLNVQP